LPGKAEKPEPKPAAAPVEATEPQVQRPPRPSSWKKDYWDAYDKLDPKVAQYIHQREAEFAQGVSTYKTDYDRAKPLLDVVGQYEPFLRQNNMTPENAVSRLFQTDQTLRFGDPQKKLELFANMITEYRIPVHEMLVQGEDGKVYFNQQYFKAQTQAQPQGLTQADVQKMLQQEKLTSLVEGFKSAKDDKGNPKHPHFETVRKDMDGLLRLGLAPDLETAYSKALRMHDDIWEAEQQARQAATQKAAQDAQQRQVAKAKAAAISPKTATPGAEGAKSAKGIRSHLEAAVDANTQGGRV